MRAILPNLSQPIEVYRFGWLVLAGTSAVYLFFLAIRVGLGLNFEVAQTPRQDKTASLNPTNHKHVQRQYRQTHTQQNPVRQNNTAQYRVQKSDRMLVQKWKQAPTATVQKANMLVIERKKVKPVQRRQPVKTVPTRNTTSTNNFIANQTNPFNGTTGVSVGTLYNLQPQQRRIQTIKAVKPKKNTGNVVFGVSLLKGKSVNDIRKHWSRLKARYAKLRPLAPLIIKEDTGDRYPIKLLVGPFNTATKAVKFCASLQKNINCTLKRYIGTPL